MTAANIALTAPLRLLRLPEVLVRVGLGRSAWYDLVRAGRAPQPCHLGERCVAWPEHEIAEWVAARIAERPTRELARGTVRA